MARHTGLPHNEVAHRWANDLEGEDHGQGHNMFFEDKVVYSYGHHFPIARHIENDRGESAVLFTTDAYGTSTAKHKTITSRACHHLAVFHVPHINEYFGEARHERNMAHYQKTYDLRIARAETMTCNSYSTVQDALEYARGELDNGNSYAAFFNLDDCVIPAWTRHLEWIEDRYARLTSPEAKAERSEKLRRKNARLIERWMAGDDVHLPGSIDPTEAETKLRIAVIRERYSSEIAAYAAGERDHIGQELKACMTEAQDAQHRAFDMERHKEKIAQWRSGERVSFGYGTGVPCMLRLKTKFGYGAIAQETFGSDAKPYSTRPEAQEIETSWGARFPVADATTAFRFIQIIRKRGECYIPNGEQAPKLGHYKIERIAADGTVRAGCHTVAWPEIESIARQLGLIS